MRILITFLLLGSTYISAQNNLDRNYIIEYERTVNSVSPFGDKASHASYYDLVIAPSIKKSLFVKKNEQVRSEDQAGAAPILEFKPNGKNQQSVYKEYLKNRTYSQDMISFKFFTVLDTLTMMDWVLHSESKEILTYTCQKATTSFRGRDYTAWFTKELPQGGPWKYDGLPGLILSIYSKDDYISYKATSLQTQQEGLDIALKNPFNHKKTLSFKEFKALYKKKAIEDSHYKAENGGEMTIVTARMRTERYIEEDDEDYKVDKIYIKN